MTFNELKQDIGIGNAVVLCYDKLDESFFPQLTFEDWGDIYGATWYSKHPLKDRSIKEMEQRAVGFKDLYALMWYTNDEQYVYKALEKASSISELVNLRNRVGVRMFAMKWDKSYAAINAKLNAKIESEDLFATN